MQKDDSGARIADQLDAVAAPPKTCSLFVLGRIRGITRKRLAELCGRHGWNLASKPSGSVTMVAIGEGTARAIIESPPRLALPAAIRATVALLSEFELKRALGLVTRSVDDQRTLTEEDLSRASGLSAQAIHILSLYDLVWPVEGRYAFRDLLVSREVHRLVSAGYDLGSVVESAVHLQRAGRSLSDTRIGLDPNLSLEEEVTGQIGDAKGQFRLKLDDRPLDEDETFSHAEEAEAMGELAEAERGYRLLMRVDRTDPVVPFNLGNVLAAAGRPDEAALAYREAIARDGSFAEAWLNLAVAAESRGRPNEADLAYAGALQARPDYQEALFSAALFHTRLGNESAAAPLWNRFLATDPPSADAALAKRQLRALTPATDRRSGLL